MNFTSQSMMHETRYDRHDTAVKFHYLHRKPFGNDHICFRSLHQSLFHDRRQECLIESNTVYEKVLYHLINNRTQENRHFPDCNHA